MKFVHSILIGILVTETISFSVPGRAFLHPTRHERSRPLPPQLRVASPKHDIPSALSDITNVEDPSEKNGAVLGPREVKVSDNFNEDISVDMQVCLQKLEKRLKEGPGALSSSEVSDLEDAFGRIVEDIELKLQQGPSPPATGTAAAADSDAPANGSVDSAVVAKPPPPSPEDELKLRTAVSKLDATTVSDLLKAGLEMDEAMTNAAFWGVVKAVDRAEEQDLPLSADVPRMLHHIFEADMQHLLTREKLTTNVTCMQPDESQGVKAAARRMNYIFDDGDHKNMPLTEGRRCEGGSCCDKCSRNIFPTFATDAESSLETFPELSSLTFNDLRRVESSTILQFVRLIERVRRTIAHEYGLPLSTVLPLQAYSRKYVAGSTQRGGGGGEGDFVILHTDESTHAGYHYSCVLYLNTQGEDFEGGDFIFNDPARTDAVSSEGEDKKDKPTMSLSEEIRRAGRDLTAFHPTKGAAVIFSSGWENMHEVETITSGTRYAVPCFFTTCPVPEAHYEQMVVGKPKTDEDIADDWLHLLLAHRHETPMESAGRVKELMMKWHYMCAPLSEH